MQKQENWPPERVFKWVLPLLIGLFIPAILIGVDFTDSGYHLYNQSHLFARHNVLSTVGYYWLTDLISAVLLQISPWKNLFVVRLLGFFTWLGIGYLAYRFFKSFLKSFTGKEVEPLALALSLAVGIAFSIKHSSSFLILPDYFTVPILFILVMLLLIETRVFPAFSVHIKPPNGTFFTMLIVNLILPWLRWPLAATNLVFAIFLLIYFYTRPIQTERPRILLMATLAFLFQLVCLLAYKIFVLDDLITKNSVPVDYLQSLSQMYAKEFLKVLPMLACALIFLGANFFLFRHHRRFAKILSVVGMVFLTALFILTYDLSIQHSTFQFQDYLPLLVWMCGGLAFLFFCLFVKRTRSLWMMATLLLILPCVYFLGTDTGIRKSSYLGFLCSTPFLYLLATQYFRARAGQIFLSFCLLLSLVFLYQNTYRDNNLATFRNPTLIFDLKVGFAISHPRTQQVLESFDALIETLDPSLKKVVMPNAPLLAMDLELLKSRLVWPEILRDLPLMATEVCSQHPPFELIVAKFDLSSVAEKIPNQPEKYDFFKELKSHCTSMVLKTETDDFWVYLVN